MAAPSWLPEGMDLSSCYLLEIKLVGTTRKDMRCFSLSKVLDADTTNWKEFIESIVEEFPPGYKEVPFVQYFDAIAKCYPEVKTDQELQLMFQKHIESKNVCMFIGYYDPSKSAPEPITEWPYSPCKTENVEAHDVNVGEQEDDTYLANPLLENEHVGVDEEGMYLGKEAADAMVVCTKLETDNVEMEGSSSGSEDEEDLDSSSDFEEEECLVGKDSLPDHVGNIEYDTKDPPMTVGSTYPNMEEYKVALSQHAIKNEFEYKREKSDPSRLKFFTLLHILNAGDGSSQLKSLSIEYPASSNALATAPKVIEKKRAAGKKAKGKVQPKGKAKKMKAQVPPDSPAMGTRSKILLPSSPAMGTRSKTLLPSSPAMGTRSKRRLSL